MKYLIIGAGGTGGILGAYMTKAGKNVTLIARNAHLAAMKEHGLTVRHLWDETVETIPVQAENMESYEKKIETAGEEEKPDVILVCVKGYSLDSTVPFIRKIAKKSTIVIPILNIYGTGSRLQEKLPGILVTVADYEWSSLQKSRSHKCFLIVLQFVYLSQHLNYRWARLQE